MEAIESFRTELVGMNHAFIKSEALELNTLVSPHTRLLGRLASEYGTFITPWLLLMSSSSPIIRMVDIQCDVFPGREDRAAGSQ